MSLFIAGCTGAKSGQNQEQERHNWQTENLKGAVKSYTQSVYKATDMFGKIKKGDRDHIAFSGILRFLKISPLRIMQKGI